MTTRRATHGGKRDGAGRKPAPIRYVRRLISLHPDVDALLTDMQRAYGLSRSQVIMRLVLLPLNAKLQALEPSPTPAPDARAR